MSKIVYDFASVIFGASLIDDVAEFLSQIMGALETVYTMNSMQSLMAILTGIAGVLMTMYFYMAAIDMATKDMVTTERYVMLFIKWFVGMAVLIYLPDIIYKLFHLCSALYDYVASDNGFQSALFTGKTTYFGHDTWPTYSEIQSDWEGKFAESFLNGLKKNAPAFFYGFIPWIVGKLATFAAYFLVVSNAVMLIAKTAFAPLGVAQCFSDGQRSAGVIYLKKVVAEMLTFAVIFGILFAASKLQVGITDSMMESYNNAVTVDNITEIMRKSAIPMTVIRLAAVGGMFKASQLANDIVGS